MTRALASAAVLAIPDGRPPESLCVMETSWNHVPPCLYLHFVSKQKGPKGDFIQSPRACPAILVEAAPPFLAAAAASLAAPAVAADLPAPPPAFAWTGFYRELPQWHIAARCFLAQTIVLGG